MTLEVLQVILTVPLGITQLYDRMVQELLNSFTNEKCCFNWHLGASHFENILGLASLLITDFEKEGMAFGYFKTSFKTTLH